MTDAELTTHAKAEISSRIDEMKLEELVLFTRAELCGKFNVMPRALDELKIPRIDLTGNGTAIRYRLDTVKEFLKRKEALK